MTLRRLNPRARTGAAVAAGVLIALFVTASAVPAKAPRAHPLYWGAWIGSQFTGTEAPFDMNAVTKFEQVAGAKKLSLIEFSSPFEDCYKSPCVPYPFPAGYFDSIRSYGAIPLFSWGSNAIPIVATARSFTLARVAAGDFDPYIRAWAKAAADWGHPFFLRFDWEMNGHWFPWGWGNNGNKPGDFIRAWRHVHTIFQQEGARNANWVWCPNVDPGRVFGPLQILYPGSRYVDWTCVDVYNRSQPWLSFDRLFASTYKTISALAPGKPMLIGEIATTEKGGSKSAWITGFLHNLTKRYPLVNGIAWFEKFDSGYDWPIETSASSQAAFSREIASPLFEPNRYANLSGGFIRPPR
jgi:Glycosyl hydrolase family 26